MEKVDLIKQFAYRLKDAMLAAGLNSNRSTSGVCIHKLAEITGYSVQICRRYLRGEAIPEPSKLLEIAKKLHVSAGWLMFGDEESINPSDNNSIVINKNSLNYIFSKASKLYNAAGRQDEIPKFLMDLVTDISQINANEEQSKKIIDLALTSANYFNEQNGTQ